MDNIIFLIGSQSEMDIVEYRLSHVCVYVSKLDLYVVIRWKTILSVLKFELYGLMYLIMKWYDVY